MAINKKPSKRGSLQKAMGAKKQLGGELGEPKSSMTVRNNQWSPQTRTNIYYDLANAGLVGSGLDSLTLNQWNTLTPEETIPFMDREKGFDYTIGNTANPGGIKYWRMNERGDVPKNRGFSDYYFKEKKATEKLLQKKALGGILSMGDNILSGIQNVGGSLIDAFGKQDNFQTDRSYKINAGSRIAKGALGGLKFGSIGILGGAIAAGVGAKKEQKQIDEALQEQRFNRDVSTRFSTMSESPTYMPVARQGGFTVYKGETHEGPNGGILTDEQGNPTGLSNNKPIALTEKDEVARFNPHTGSTYIYSNTLGFAKPATSLVRKYKLDKEGSPYKYDSLLQTAVDRQFDNLTTAQEFSKETKTSSKDSIGMFRKGGNLTATKAKEMLKDGTAHGKKLTAKQKGYFGWVAGGKKEYGGELPMYPDGGESIDPEKRKIPGLFNRKALMEYYNPRPSPDPNSSFLQLYFRGKEPTGRPSILNSQDVVSPSIGPMTPIAPNYHLTDKKSNTSYISGKPDLSLPELPNFSLPQAYKSFNDDGSPIRTGTGSGTSSSTANARIQREAPISRSSLKNLLPGNDINQLQGTNNPFANVGSEGEGDESFTPWLSPLGHVLSGVGAIADYAAMRKAKPTPLSLSRVGAERIDLSRQRLMNERNAASSRAVNTASARGLGMNAGATMANIGAANTGVNRLLGEQNMQSLLAEESTNAQMQQQANMINAELAAQEGMFNTQRTDAYNMLRARMNPTGALARTAASYFADNAAYGRGYDTAQMLSPDAELYQDPKSNFWRKMVGIDRPQFRHRDKQLMNKNS